MSRAREWSGGLESYSSKECARPAAHIMRTRPAVSEQGGGGAAGRSGGRVKPWLSAQRTMRTGEQRRCSEQDAVVQKAAQRVHCDCCADIHSSAPHQGTKDAPASPYRSLGGQYMRTRAHHWRERYVIGDARYVDYSRTANVNAGGAGRIRGARARRARAGSGRWWRRTGHRGPVCQVRPCTVRI